MFYQASKIGWVIAEPGNFLVLLALLGLVLSFGRRQRLGRALIAMPLLAMLALAVFPVGEHVLSTLERRFPVWQHDGQAVDGIIVLGGAVNPELYKRHSGSGLSAAVGRITEAAALAHRFKTARVVFAGGGVAGSDLTEAHVAAEIFGNLGIDASRLTLDTTSRNTSENAYFAKRVAKPETGQRWLLVTSAFHMPRAIGCFRQAGFPVIAHPVDYRYQTGPSRGAAWDASSVVSGLTSVNLALHELAGLAAYSLTERTSAWFPAP